MDDERGVLQALKRALGRFGFDVLLSESAEDALVLLGERAAWPQPDLPQVILSDHRLLRMDGVTFLAQVKERWPHIQRVLITGFADLDAIERAINEAGIYRFVNKPWEDVSLLGTVRSAVEQWQAVDENQRLLKALEDHNRDLEEAVAVRTQELLKAQQMWERTFDAIADPLMVIDEDYRIQRANRALALHLGLPEGSVLSGQVCHELRAESKWRLQRSPEGPCAGCPVARTRATHAQAEAELSSAAGFLALKTFSLDHLTVCGYQDVTRERQAARQLALTDRLAAIGQLAGGVAHEINNPLSGILALSQLMLRDLDVGGVEEGELREFLVEIESASLRCKRIVDHLLRFSRQARRDEVERVNLNALVHEALPLIEHQYAIRGVRTVCHLDPDLPDVLGSGARLQQVLMTLLSNAFDATQLAAGPPPGQIQLTTAARGDAVLLIVRDQGAGIDEGNLTQLFLPFFTTKPAGRGTGLGLAVSYGIVTDHGGHIEAHNVPGGGAEFVVRLPSHRSPDAPPPA